MAHSHVIGGESLSQAQPQIRTIGFADLKDALARGLDDFLAMPSHAVFLCLIYPVVGFVLWPLVLGANVLPLLFPLAAGFALIGPFAALGLYEMSRRREQGLEVSWRHALDVCRSPSLGAIAVLGAVAGRDLPRLDRGRAGDLRGEFRLHAGRFDAGFHPAGAAPRRPAGR